MEAQRQDLATSVGLLILRLGVGGYMLTHGWGKLQLLLAGDFDKFADPIGIGKEPSLAGIVGAEFVAALFVVAGFFTRFAALPVVFAMGVAALVVHGDDPWTMKGGPPSKEPALLFLTAFLALAFTGAGRFSVDGWRAGRKATG